MKRRSLQFVVLFVLVMPLVGHAATLIVNTASDEVIDDNFCSLREAIIATNQDADFSGCIANSLPYGADRIVFDPAIAGQSIVLTETGAVEGFAQTGDLDILGDLVIDGAELGTEIDGNDADRVFDIREPGIEVTFNRLFITGGFPPPVDFLEGRGGGIRMEVVSTLKLNDCSVFRNSISSGTDNLNGGGISSAGTLIIHRSEIDDNSLTSTFASTSGVFGGGIWSSAGNLHIYDSRIVNNTAFQAGTALSRGGGIAAQAGGTLNLVRTEISNNTARSMNSNATGGGVYTVNGVNVLLSNSTISGNEARSESASNGQQSNAGGARISLDGIAGLTINSSTIFGNVANSPNGALAFVGGINTGGGDILLANTIIGGNTANGSSSDCNDGNQFMSFGFNLVENNCGITPATGDWFDVVPLLGPLGSGGGANTITNNPQSHRPQAGSPLIDAGNPVISGTFPDCPPTDQRGFVRVGIGGPVRCDIGAHEFDSPFLDQLFSDSFED